MSGISLDTTDLPNEPSQNQINNKYTRTCKKCCRVLSLENFRTRKTICIECVKQHQQNYRLKNRDKINTRKRKYYWKYKDRNREKVNSKSRERYWSTRTRRLKLNVFAKSCTVCLIIKPTIEFRKYRRVCKSCNYIRDYPRIKKLALVYYHKNKDKIQEKRHNQYITDVVVRRKVLDNNYKQKGISIDDFEKLVKNQNSVCPLCLKITKLVADHSHKFEKFRGAICNRCNTGIGLFYENIDLMLRACLYLRGEQLYLNNSRQIEYDYNYWHRRSLLLRSVNVYISELDLYGLLKSQGFVCAICQATEILRNLVVDHCHNTYRVRGFLCRNCNLAVGHFYDSPEIIENVVNYLRLFAANNIVSQEALACV